VPILRDFERRLGNMVEGFFATAFRSGLQPVELAKRILREMDAGKSVGVKGVWAPNHFVFTLSSEDAERFQQVEGALVGELKQVVRDAAAERGWGLVGPPVIEFRTDDSIGRGQFGCEATLVEGEPEPAPAPSARGGEAAIVLLQEGHEARTYQLHKQSVAIGRLPECDIVISDPGASRRHATITREDGSEYVLTDLGSTNGTLVNDEPVGEHVLSDGDRITIGNTVLEFRRQ
jgi:FhaA, N-terminal domain/FHA domain